MISETIQKYEKVKDAIKKSIISGKYKNGDLIPSENELVREFKVSKQTVLKALGVLVNEGLVFRRQGKGTFVSEISREVKRRIAVIVFHSDNSYYSKIIKGVEQVMTDSSFDTILCNSEGNAQRETEHIKRLLDTVDGFILSPVVRAGEYSEGVRKILDSCVPLTFLSNIANENQLNGSADYVIPDDCVGGFMAGRHLVECGYKDFKFLTAGDGLKFDTVRERLRGFKFALAQDGVVFDSGMVVESSASDAHNGYEADGYKAAEKILPEPKKPLGIFAVGDQIGIGLMRGLKEKGIKIPEEVGICGFDDIDLARQWGIELTTIAQKKTESGMKAAEILLRKIKNTSSGPEHITMPVELIKRKTTMKLSEISNIVR